MSIAEEIGLNVRERRVLSMLADGSNSKEIARSLEISVDHARTLKVLITRKARRHGYRWYIGLRK